MTLYRLYTQNGNCAGFWVQHRTWGNMCAQVQSIAGHRSGMLPGKAPLHDCAEVVINAFDVRSGRPMQLAAAPLELEDRKYSLIAEPCWSHRHPNLWPRRMEAKS
ncbi:MAG: hypothetical protein ACREJC_11600 [Tepidisphaeraceae bacterium]